MGFLFCLFLNKVFTFWIGNLKCNSRREVPVLVGDRWCYGLGFPHPPFKTQFNTYVALNGRVISHMQSIWDSNMTFSEFSDVDHPFEAEGKASVERSDWRLGLLLSASVSFSVLSSQLMWNLVTLGLDAKMFLCSWKTRFVEVQNYTNRSEF